MNIVIAIGVLSFLIIIHELGHFIAARINGVKVLEFSIFMGPKLFSIKRGETVYSLRAIPMGGYVKMEGEEAESDDSKAFNKKSVGARSAIIAAGPLTNIIFAILILCIIFSIVGYTTTTYEGVMEQLAPENMDLKPGDKIIKIDGKRVFSPNDIELFVMLSNGEPVELTYKNEEGDIRDITVYPVAYPKTKYLLGFTPVDNPDGGVLVAALTKGKYPAKNIGLLVGDIITAINDTNMNSPDEIKSYLTQNGVKPIELHITRDGEPMSFNGVVPVENTSRDFYTLGIMYKEEKGNVLQAITNAGGYSISVMRSVLYSIPWLIQGKLTGNDVAGPVGIVSQIGEVVEQGENLLEKFQYVIQMLIVISLNLGIMNLMPFPALDGSKLVILLIEKVRRKPMKPEREAMISMIGLILLTCLLIFATYNDLIKFF